jgi:hypothetical protein
MKPFAMHNMSSRQCRLTLVHNGESLKVQGQIASQTVSLGKLLIATGLSVCANPKFCDESVKAAPKRLTVP